MSFIPSENYKSSDITVICLTYKPTWQITWQIKLWQNFNVNLLILDGSPNANVANSFQTNSSASRFKLTYILCPNTSYLEGFGRPPDLLKLSMQY